MNFPSEEIHIYQTFLSTKFHNSKTFEKNLSEDEIKKAYRYKFEKDKKNYITARAILRKLLGNYLSIKPGEIKFSYAEKGKPFLENSQLKFNLSHSKDYAIYSFASEKEVGIDVEFIKEMDDALEIAKRFFSENEIKNLIEISSKKINQAFFNCWTRKEAFIKAIGEGLSYPLKSFSVSLKPGENPKVLWVKKNDAEASQWSLINLKTEKNYIASLAVRAKNVKIVYKKIEDIW